MQSSRRKRERVENGHDDGGGAASSRAPTKLKTSPDEDAADASVPEVTPQVADTKTTTGQVQGATNTTEGTNGGNNLSRATTTESATMDTSSNEVAPGSGMMARQDNASNQTDSGTRQKQISALISHRKILLERMKQCKTAADSRRKRNVEKQKVKTNSDINAEKQDGGQSSSDSEEIEKYRETCRRTAEANRKQKTQPTDSAAERRSSVSLRRGSGVGQRMNAALSSLAPGSVASASMPPSDPSAIMPVTTVSEIPPAAASAVPGVMPVPNSKQAALMSAQQRVQPVIQSAPVNTFASVPSTQKCGGGQQGQRRRSASTSQRAPKSFPGPASLTQASSSLPLHAGTATSGLPFNRLAHPTVNFPEARALREKRDVIRTKLNALIHERLERIQQTSNVEKADAAEASLKSLSVAAAERPSVEEYRLALPRMVLERGVNSPSHLPSRRKTHWDYLLEEVRWLATDFVEERKWKAASARTLASAVVSSRLNAVAPIESATGSGKENGNVEGDSAPEDAKESAKEESEVEGDMSTEMLENMGVRNYSRPELSETKVVRTVAHIISDMVAEVWTGTIDSGLLASTDEPLMSALARHHKLRKAIENEEDSSDSQGATDKPLSSLAAGSEEDKENGSTAPDGKAPETLAVLCEGMAREGEQVSVKETIDWRPLSSEDISKRIYAASDRVKNRAARRNRSRPTTKEPITLGTEQREGAEFVEFIWENDESIAPCLDGDVATGKTVLSCSLLWRRLSEGPQLLVCSPSRLIRWVYELERFSGVNVCVFGRRCGLSSAIPGAQSHSEFQAGDVVVCEFSSLVQRDDEEEGGEIHLDLFKFRTVVMDARFPTASMLSATNEAQEEVSGTPGENLIPPELISHRWWAVLLKSLRTSNTQRLLIDNSECRFLSEEESLGHVGLSDRQRLDTLAAMAAFVVGPELFSCQETRSVQHKVVSWAKHSAKEGNARKRPLYGEVRGVIADAALPFRYTIPSKTGEEVDVNQDKWVARLCSLSVSQRSAYENCCAGVRGALAFGSITDYADSQQRPEPYEHTVQGLMKLRRVCVHSHVEEVLGKWSRPVTGFVGEPLSSIVNSAGSRTAVGSSVSQPDADIAADILSGSAKLRELVTILRGECGFGVTEDSTITQTEGEQEEKRKRKAKTKKVARKRVAILAVLPEVQLLTSILLNAIGIQNEMLGSPSFKPNEDSTVGPVASFRSHSDSRFVSNLYSSMVFIDSQLSLLRFSSSGVGDDGVRLAACQVVIASPFLVAADNGGLGIEAADVVVCLDEDWSGRDSNILHRISKKCSFAHEMKTFDKSKKKNAGCSFVRLVCEKTCEHVFLSGINDRTSSGQDWPTDGRGLLTLAPRSKPFDVPLVAEDHQVIENAVGCHFHFPATNVLRFRGKVLSTVLLPAKPIPPMFATGDPVRFLPFQEWEQDTEGDKRLSLELLWSLVAEEDRSRLFWKQEYSLRSEGVVDGSPQESPIVPPFPADFPGGVVTRHDMLVITSRHYLDRFGNHLAQIGGTGSNSGPDGRLAGPSAFGISSGGTNCAITGEHWHLLDAWRKTASNRKPDDLVPSLLSYRAADAQTSRSSDLDGKSASRISQSSDIQGLGTVTNQPSISFSPRPNVLSASFCLSREAVSNLVGDGNQGFEPLAYFPPLFPGLFAASEQAQNDAAHAHLFNGRLVNSGVGLASNEYELDPASRKRKEPAVTYQMTGVASKRPRLDKPSSVVQYQSTSSLPSQRSGADAASSNIEMAPSYVVPSGGGLLSERDGRSSSTMNPSIVTEDESSQWDQSSVLFDIGEDYGLLGVGALSSDSESARHVSTASVDVLSYSKWRDPYEANGVNHEIFSSTISCDAEEIEAYVRGEVDDSFLDTMLLFVAKRAPTGFSSISAPSTASQQIGGLKFSGANSAWVQSMRSGPDGQAMNGAGKKGKRKSQTQVGMHVGGFSRTNPDLAGQYTGSSSLHTSKGRESYRSKILASILARQGGGRASLFQVPSFLLSSIRIRDDVLRRVLSQSQRQLTSRHPPYPVHRSWKRAAYKLNSPTSQTGDSALRMSKRQRVKMSTAPAPVDFGPFVAGYISPTYHVCGVLPRSTVTGISLPMGVKIPRRSAQRQMQAWAVGEEQKLKECVLRYGVNWHLVATAVNRFDYEEAQRMSRMVDSAAPFPLRQSRSPGQCQERWNHLVELDPDLIHELRCLERLRHDRTLMKPTPNEVAPDPAIRLNDKRSSPDDTVSLILSSSLRLDEDGDEVMEEKQRLSAARKGRGNKSFAALRNAAKRAVKVTLPIPGSINGEKPTLVQSHSSHAQAVQVAVSATVGGKPDMWPLQILDNASGTNSAGSSRQASGAAPLGHQVRSPGRQGSPNRQPRPHASFQVPQNAMASPSRGSQQGYPPMNTNGGPVARGPPPRGPAPPVGKSRSTK